MHLGIYKMWFYTRCKFQTYTPWKSFEFKTLIGEILNNFVLHFSVWGDLWPYCNAYVRPATRANFFRCCADTVSTQSPKICPSHLPTSDSKSRNLVLYSRTIIITSVPFQKKESPISSQESFYLVRLYIVHKCSVGKNITLWMLDTLFQQTNRLHLVTSLPHQGWMRFWPRR